MGIKILNFVRWLPKASININIYKYSEIFSSLTVFILMFFNTQYNRTIYASLYLIGFTWSTKLFKPLSQSSPHVDDSISHGLYAVSPFFIKGWIFEHSVYNPASMSWRIRVGGADDEGHLGSEIYCQILGFKDHSEVASSLIVKTKILWEWLSTEQFKSSLHEVSNSPSICIKTSTCKSLKFDAFNFNFWHNWSQD